MTPRPYRPRPTDHLRSGPNRNAATARVNAMPMICCLCGHPIDRAIRAPHPMSLTAEHRVPLARGGHPTAPDNLAPAHRICNSRKGAGPKPAVRDADAHSQDW